jgi:hypothetical protein
MTNTEIRTFILENGNVMTNEQMAMACGVGRMKMAGQIAPLKRSGDIGKTWLKSDIDAINLKNKKKATKDEYGNIDGKGKNDARSEMIWAIIQSGLVGVILTLPSLTCIIEKLLTQANNNKKELFSFIGVEMNDGVYNKMLTAISRMALNFEATYKKPISYVIDRARENEFKHIILDYCGQIGTYAEDIRKVLVNNLVEVGGTIHITLNLRLSGNDGIVLRKAMEKIVPYVKNDEYTRTHHLIRTFIQSIGMDNYEIINEFKYTDSSTMLLVILKRVK